MKPVAIILYSIGLTIYAGEPATPPDSPQAKQRRGSLVHSPRYVSHLGDLSAQSLDSMGSLIEEYGSLIGLPRPEDGRRSYRSSHKRNLSIAPEGTVDHEDESSSSSEDELIVVPLLRTRIILAHMNAEILASAAGVIPVGPDAGGAAHRPKKGKQ